MGWSDLGDGCYDGDGPADAIATGLDLIADEGRRRDGRLPSGLALLRSFVDALNLDGSRAPFYSEPRRIEAMVCLHGGRRVRIDASKGVPWIIAELYLALDEIAECYVESWHRAPHLSELAHYVGYHLREEEVFRTRISDEVPWDLREGKFILSKKRKPAERSAAPEDRGRPSTAKSRVRHPKFGEGDIVSEEGDRLTVVFGGERRVVMRSFVRPV